MIIDISEKYLKEWIEFCLDVNWEGTIKGTKDKWFARIPANLQKKIVKGTVAYLKAFKVKSLKK